MRPRALAATALLALLAGCGGGSDPSPTPTPTPTPTPETTATAEATTAPGTAFESGDTASQSSTRLTPGRLFVVRRPLAVEGEPVQVERARVPFPASVRVRPVRRARGDGITTTFADRERWPPRDTDGPLAGSEVAGSRTDAVVGFTPTEPGVVVLDGLDLTYRRDGQRFLQTVGDLDCFVVGPGPSACDLASDFPPENGGVVGMGVSFPRGEGTRLRKADDQGLGVEVVLDGTPHAGELTIPLVNRSDEPATVGDFSRIRNVQGERTLTLRTAETADLELAPGEVRDVTLDYRLSGCSDGQQLGASGSFPATDSRTNEAIPLGVWIAVGPGPRC